MAIVMLVAALLLAAPAAAQTADRPVVEVGDRWRFVVYYSAPSTTPNRTWVITSVTPEGIDGTENGEPLKLTPELNVLVSSVHTDSNPKSLSFPLAVGKQWRYVSDWTFKPKSSNGRNTVDVSVIGYEKVRVPAGEYDAFKLVAKGRVGGTAPIGSQYNAETTTTYWYAPATRAIVKSVHHNPYLGTSNVELVDFRKAHE